MLRICGSFVIVFGCWSVLKVLMALVLTPLNVFLEENGLAPDQTEFPDVIFIVYVILLAIDLAFRVYIGLSARKEEKGKKKSIFYLICDGLLILLTVIGIVLQIGIMSTVLSLSGIATFIFDLASLFVLINVMVASIKLRKLVHMQRAQDEALQT